jgi:hypothetical protein
VNDLNASILNYLLVNGYKKTFDEFSAFLGQTPNLKLIMNHKERLESELVLNDLSKSQTGRRHSGSFVRKESEGGSGRKPSLIRTETSTQKDNEEVVKFLNTRSSLLTRSQESHFVWENRGSIRVSEGKCGVRSLKPPNDSKPAHFSKVS